LELFPPPNPEADGEDGDEKEDLSVCSACDERIALASGTLIHVDGRPCVVRQHATSELADTPADEPPGATILAPAALMGGTHQKGKRGRPPRNREREAIADGSAEDEQSTTVQ